MLFREHCIDAEKTVGPPIATGSRSASGYRGNGRGRGRGNGYNVVVVVGIGIVAKDLVPVVNGIGMAVASI